MNQQNKAKILLNFLYSLIIITLMIIIFLSVVYYKKANSINPQVVRTHTTQIDLTEFNKILEKIKVQLENN